MRYLIWTTDDQSDLLYASAPVQESHQAYFSASVMPHLRPVTADFYIGSFAVLVQTTARWSYLLAEDKLYWCILWTPGMLVLEISEDGTLRAAAIRRGPANEPATGPQHHLVFDAWHAQEDATHYRANGFAPATEQERSRFTRCISQLDRLAPQVDARFQEKPETFLADCIANIAQWAGNGR